MLSCWTLCTIYIHKQNTSIKNIVILAYIKLNNLQEVNNVRNIHKSDTHLLSTLPQSAEPWPGILEIRSFSVLSLCSKYFAQAAYLCIQNTATRNRRIIRSREFLKNHYIILWLSKRRSLNGNEHVGYKNCFTLQLKCYLTAVGEFTEDLLRTTLAYCKLMCTKFYQLNKHWQTATPSFK